MGLYIHFPNNYLVWTFKGYTYIAIRMKTSSEYKFSILLTNNQESTLKTATELLTLKAFQGLCKKLNIEFTECGESKENDDIEDDE